MIKTTLFSLGLAAAALVSCAARQDGSLLEALQEQLRLHPQSTLQDIYKSFYQDTFGPGHIISDRVSARDYILREAAQTPEPADVMLEKTGAEGRYVRVSLFLVRNGSLDPEALTDAVMQSALPVTPEIRSVWPESWRKIAARASALGLPGYEKDKKALEEVLMQQGSDYAVHHSAAYSDAYDPHYRIIRADVFEALTARSCLRVNVATFAEALEDPRVIGLDVRTAEEYAEGHIPGIRLNADVQQDDFESIVRSLVPAGSTLAIHCRSGKRSQAAAAILTQAGYRVIELSSGINGWISAARPLAVTRL